MTPKEIEEKANDNLKKWKEFMSRVEIASKDVGITTDQGLKFIDKVFKYPVK